MGFALEYRHFAIDDEQIRFAQVPWDSETFGFPIVDLQLEEGELPSDQLLAGWLKSIRGSAPTLVTTKISPYSIPLAKRLCHHGFYPLETILLLELSLDRFIPTEDAVPSQFEIRFAERGDLDELCELTRHGWERDRFHLDPFIDNDRADERFVGWMRRAFNDGDPVILARDLDKDLTVGFFHYRPEDSSVVDLSSGAVSHEYRRSGISTFLYEALLRDCQDRGFRYLTTHTSTNNLASLNLSFAYGSLIRDARLTLHWFDSPTLK